MSIHPTAIVDSQAEIDPTVEIGPYVVIEGPVRIGPGTRLRPHVTILGHTTLGADNTVHSGAVLGDEPQDLSYRGQETEVRIGDRNVFREHAEVQRGAKTEATIIGNDGFFMSGIHVGHDCRVGDRVIMATGAVLGGHCEVADRAYVSGNCVAHQFVRIGRLALLRGGSRASRDVPPFCIMDHLDELRAINRIGLQRAGFDATRIRAIHGAFRQLFSRRRNLAIALAEVESEPVTDDVAHLLEFIHQSRRGICTGPR